MQYHKSLIFFVTLYNGLRVTTLMRFYYTEKSSLFGKNAVYVYSQVRQLQFFVQKVSS